MSDTLPSLLRRATLNPDPTRQFGIWLEEAEQAGLPHPNAMTLATADGEGVPTGRIVLLRGFDQSGFVFFTNYESRKGHELSENPVAALLFHWPALARQVRIEGRVEQVSKEESDVYFAGRPRGHQLEAHASAQSRVIPDRDFLEEKFTSADRKYQNRKVPRPPHWGGYRVIPDRIEFWQEGDHRLHDRLRYRRDKEHSWQIERLSP